MQNNSGIWIERAWHLEPAPGRAINRLSIQGRHADPRGCAAWSPWTLTRLRRFAMPAQGLGSGAFLLSISGEIGKQKPLHEVGCPIQFSPRLMGWVSETPKETRAEALLGGSCPFSAELKVPTHTETESTRATFSAGHPRLFFPRLSSLDEVSFKCTHTRLAFETL